jgi:hypothetical protein
MLETQDPQQKSRRRYGRVEFLRQDKKALAQV